MHNSSSSRSCGWFGSIFSFLSRSKQDWLTSLNNHHTRCMNCPADKSQQAAWEQSFEILQKELKQLVQVKPELEPYTIIFDYELSRKRGRRPDVIILGASIFVLKFTDSGEIIRADIDQVNACARDLGNYDAESHQNDVVPILVCARTKDVIRRDGDVIILSPDHIADYFNVQTELEDGPLIDANTWIISE
jgi:hypothetical protein